MAGAWNASHKAVTAARYLKAVFVTVSSSSQPVASALAGVAAEYSASAQYAVSDFVR